jgi:hypothetical protein
MNKEDYKQIVAARAKARRLDKQINKVETAYHMSKGTKATLNDVVRLRKLANAVYDAYDLLAAHCDHHYPNGRWAVLKYIRSYGIYSCALCRDWCISEEDLTQQP